MEDRPAVVAIVFAGGDPVEPELAAALPSDALRIAADSGLDQAERLGLEVDVVIGDMDSVDPATLDRAADRGAAVVRHPTDKDATDLELALAYAIDRGYPRIIVAGGDGGRIDHLLGNALLLASDRLADVEVTWWVDAARLQVARPGRPVTLHGGVGDLVSLLPIGGPAEGVTTRGLRWRLDDSALPTGTTRGLSNVMTAGGAKVSISAGVLLVIHEKKGDQP